MAGSLHCYIHAARVSESDRLSEVCKQNKGDSKYCNLCKSLEKYFVDTFNIDHNLKAPDCQTLIWTEATVCRVWKCSHLVPPSGSVNTNTNVQYQQLQPIIGYSAFKYKAVCKD